LIRLTVALFIIAASACQRPLPPERQLPARQDRTPAAESGSAGPAQTATSPPTGTDSLVISPRAAAIIDSIEAAVRDSFAAIVRDSVAAMARRDSVAAVAAAKATAEAARRDSIERAAEAAAQAAAEAAQAAAEAAQAAEAARQDSIAQAAAAAEAAQAAREDSVAAARAAIPTDLEQLKELGPSFIPYDESPGTLWNTDTQASLSLALLPVLRKEALPARTETVFWVLVTREGDVADLVIQTSSGNAAFDAAAETFARTLTFVPAMRMHHPVPTWVLREISILMR